MPTDKPKISQARIPSSVSTTVSDEIGDRREVRVTAEYPLSVFVDKQEYVTLMTLGQMPEALIIGWLRNQRLLMSVSDIEEVTVDWETNAAAVYTKSGLRQTLGKPTVTSGCGQGTMFGDFMAEMENLNLAHEAKLSRRRCLIYSLRFAFMAPFIKFRSGARLLFGKAAGGCR